MKYDFDEIVPREGTDSFKLKYVGEICGHTDVLPMWVADMDFRTPPFVIKALEKRIHQGILGYTCTNDRYYDSICSWCKEQYGMDVTPEMVNYIPGVVSGILLAVQTFTDKGDKILIQQPVYHPFRLVPQATGREVVMSPLRRTATSFEMDFEQLRKDIKGCRMMILCNPHNPAGICWSKEDLQTVAHICVEEGVIVVSDEIHCDMVLHGRRHIPFATVSEEARMNSITLHAPTKVFNMPGIVASHAIVFNPEIRKRYFGFIQGTDQDAGNVFAYDCVAACYSEEGDEWRKEMLAYVAENIDLLCSRLAEECPGITPIRPEASFLVFLDCRELMKTKGMEKQEDLICFFATKAHLALNSGDMFGSLGTGYMRMNLACPRSVLNKAIDQMVEAVKQ